MRTDDDDDDVEEDEPTCRSCSDEVSTSTGCNWKAVLYSTLTIVYLVLVFVFAPWALAETEEYAQLESVLIDPNTHLRSEIHISMENQTDSFSALLLSQTPPLISARRVLSFDNVQIRPQIFVYDSLHLNQGSFVELVYAFNANVEFHVIKGHSNFAAFVSGADTWMPGFSSNSSATTINLPIATDHTYYFVWGNSFSHSTVVGTLVYELQAMVYQINDLNGTGIRILQNCTGRRDCNFKLAFASTQCVVISIKDDLSIDRIPVTTELTGRMAFYVGTLIGSYALASLLVLVAIVAFRHCQRRRSRYETLS